MYFEWNSNYVKSAVYGIAVSVLSLPTYYKFTMSKAIFVEISLFVHYVVETIETHIYFP